jgi:WD40 repeat protein
MVLDESRRLIFVGDKDRVKSYAWGAADGTYYDELLPTHTLDSQGSGGPMVILPNGTIVRAGQGRAVVWQINELETHGDDGEEIVGIEIDIEDTWRDDPEEIELSSGSTPTSHIQFVDHPSLAPSIWQPLISAPSTVLSTEFSQMSKSYGCISIDLETGRTTARYLGHGAGISDLSVSAGDPQVFLTACGDGYARMFDTRQPLPVLTLDACGKDAFCEAVVLAHPDGIPSESVMFYHMRILLTCAVSAVFTGSGKQEQIKVWDVRARTCVYELSTGNNAVQALVWDSKRNCLYAATECMYMDRLGYHHGYRPGFVPKPAGAPQSRSHDDDDEDDDEDDEEGDHEHCWPDRAFHHENYFGYMFDAGDHRICKFFSGFDALQLTWFGLRPLRV